MHICVTRPRGIHHSDVIMSAMASQITSLTFVHSNVYPDASKKTSELRVTGLWAGIQRWPVKSPHKGQYCGNVSIWWRHFVIAALAVRFWPELAWYWWCYWHKNKVNIGYLLCLTFFPCVLLQLQIPCAHIAIDWSAVKLCHINDRDLTNNCGENEPYSNIRVMVNPINTLMPSDAYMSQLTWFSSVQEIEVGCVVVDSIPV